MVEPRSYRLLNLVLLFITVMAGYVWFVAHARPHMATFLFGSVSVLALGSVAVAVFKALFGEPQSTNAFKEWMTQLRATIVFVCALVVIAIAFAVTGTIYFESKGKEEIVLRVMREGELEKVTIDEKTPNPALTYYALFKPISLTIDTITPHGYNQHPGYILKRAWPETLVVPEPDLKKRFFLVRLFPADNFFSLRGRKTLDERYLLKVTIRGDKTPYVVKGLKFRAILLGASDTDLLDQAKETRHNETFPRNYVKNDRNADKIIAEWLDEPLRIPTRELKPGVDFVTVELTPTTLAVPRIEIPITNELNERFLTGAPK